MARDVVTVAPDETVRSVADRFLSGDPRLMRYHALPIVDREGRLVGLVTQGDILRALEQDPSGAMPVIEAGTRSPLVAYPDETVFDALTKMLAEQHWPFAGGRSRRSAQNAGLPESRQRDGQLEPQSARGVRARARLVRRFPARRSTAAQPQRAIRRR